MKLPWEVIVEYSIYCAFDIIYAYCCILLFGFFAVKRSRVNGLVTLAAAVILGGVYFVFADIFYERFFLKAFLVIGVTVAGMLMLFRIHYAKAVVLSMFNYGMLLIVEYVVVTVMGKLIWVATGRPFDLTDALVFNAVSILNKAILLGMVLWIGKKLGRKNHDILSKKEWWILFAVSFMTICLIVALAERTDVLYSKNPDSAFVYIAIGISAISFIVYYLLYDVMKREALLREHAVFREKVKSETSMYRSISENLEKQQKRTHEYKNQIAAIRALAADGKYQELDRYLGKIDHDLQHGTDAVDTNNVIVNAILNTKYREAVGKGIVFVLKVNDLSKLQMEDDDIVIILSNLLNNALEACERCEDKVIKLKFILEEGQTVISVGNSMGTRPVMENGKLLTTKTVEAQEHGMGLGNVAETVEKYGGRYAVDYGEDFFQITILIPGGT